MNQADIIRTAANINLHYLKLQVEQLPEADVAKGGAKSVNNPAWQVGHIINSLGFAAKMLGANYDSPAWSNKCGRGSTPSDDRQDYPSKTQILSDVDKAFQTTLDAYGKATPQQLATPLPDPEVRKFLPTANDLVTLMLTSHMAMHVGQIAAWRRNNGFAQVFG